MDIFKNHNVEKRHCVGSISFLWHNAAKHVILGFACSVSKISNGMDFSFAPGNPFQ